MATRPSSLAVFALLALAVPAAAQQQLPPAERYHLRLEYLWWSPQPEGQLQKGFSDQEGTLVDVQSDLGLQKSSANSLRGALRLGDSWKLRGSWAPIDFRGDVAAANGFEYGTAVVEAGDQVRTSIQGNYGTAELEWDFLRRPQGFAGILLGAKFFDVDTLLLNVDTEDRVAETQRLPIPVVGLAGRIYVGRHFSMEGEFSGLTLGDRGHVWEWTIAARVPVSDRLAGTGGYHRLALEGRNDRDYLKLDLGQWTFGVEISL
jgi:hypothetical protein